MEARPTRAEIAAAARARHAARRELAAGLAADHDGVLTRAMLRNAGLTKGQVRVEVERGAFVPVGRHTLSVVGSPLTGRAVWWCALWESGKHAVLDGATSLIATGLKNWDEKLLHVSVPNNAQVRPLGGVRHHFLRDLGEVIDGGLRRTKPHVAAVRAAQWAVSDRQAATILAMTVQQRLARPSDVLAQWESVQYTNRRRWLTTVIRDICDGAQSLGELDFAALCRERGLPEPSRQVVRPGEKGRTYLDVFWDEFNVHVEVQGVQHSEGIAVIEDALRFNDLSLKDSDLISLQVPVLGLRLFTDRFLDQIEVALTEGRRRRAA